MKKNVLLISLLLVFSILFCLTSCDIINNFLGKENTDSDGNAETPGINNNGTEGENTVSKTGVWTNATYLCDMEFGTGAKSVQVEVKAAGQSVTFTIHTDKETLGEALLEHNLISGENAQYGLYIKFVNGIEADYDKDMTYWAFYSNGEYMFSGVDGTKISDGAHYELSKEK